MNAIDSRATEIRVYVQIPSNNSTPDNETPQIVVVDNGHGISAEQLKDFIAEWNHTSKPLAGDEMQYGFKGEALAAIRALCIKLEIETKERESLYSYIKTMKTAENSQQNVTLQQFVDENEDRSGTSIYVFNLYHNLSVRARAIRPDLEMNYIKDFVRRMSVLHYSINWLLVDKAKNKIIFRALGQSSVSKRFISLHGLDVFLRMKVANLHPHCKLVFHYTMPGDHASCHWTKDFQYLYLNSRWMKNNDPISHIIDRLFRRILLANKLGGPSAMHHSPSKPQNACHPCFILQIKCDSSEYDIFCEPDKSCAIYRDLPELFRCLFNLLQPLFLEYIPACHDLFLTEFIRLTGSASMDPITSAGASIVMEGLQAVNGGDQNEEDFEQTVPLPLYKVALTVSSFHSNDTNKGENLIDLTNITPSKAFNSAFYSSPSSCSMKLFSENIRVRNRPLSEKAGRPNDYSHSPSISTASGERDEDVYSEEGDIVIGAFVRRSSKEVSHLLTNSEVNFSSSETHERRVNSFCANEVGSNNHYGIETELDSNYNEKSEINARPLKRVKYDLRKSDHGDYDIVNEYTDDAYLIHSSARFEIESPLSEPHKISIQDNSLTLRSMDGIESANTCEEYRENADEVSPMLLTSEWNPDFDFHYSTENHFSTSTPAKRAVKLDKAMLDFHSIVGQWDCKFVIATVENRNGNKSIETKERHGKTRLVLLFDQHALDERLNFEKCQVEYASCSSRRRVDASADWTTIVTHETAQIINAVDDVLSLWFKYDFGKCDGKGDRGIDLSVVLLETPLVLGESLTVNDFLEFVFYLHENMHKTPSYALKPPAVGRILAFRSCHSSVRFGDTLSTEHCKDMLNRLKTARFPFQCAHGRPSVVPLLEYADGGNIVRASVKPNYLRIFEELGALNVDININV